MKAPQSMHAMRIMPWAACSQSDLNREADTFDNYVAQMQQQQNLVLKDDNSRET